MKIRIVSLCLVLTMVISLLPAAAPKAAASGAAALDYQTASELGMDVFTAWFHTANHVNGGVPAADVYQSALGTRQYSPFRILVRQILLDKDYQNALLKWKRLTFDAETLATSETALYVTLLHDMLKGDGDSLSVNDLVSEDGSFIGDTMELAGSEVGTAFLKHLFEDRVLEPMMKDTAYTYKNMVEYVQRSLDPEAKELVSSRMIEYLGKQTGKISFLQNEVLTFLGEIPDLYEMLDSAGDAVDRISEIYALAALDDSFYNVLSRMMMVDGVSDHVVNAAAQIIELKYLYQSEEGKENILRYIAGDMSETALKKELADMAFNTLKKLPIMKGIELGQAVSKFVCNLLFATEDQNAIAYTLIALGDIEDALYRAAAYHHEEFLKHPTEENAKNFNAVMRMIYRFSISANQYAMEYADTIYKGGLASLIRSIWCGDEYDKWKSGVSQSIKLNKVNLYWYDYGPKVAYERQQQTFLVTYDGNGGTNVPAQQVKQYGVEMALSSVTPYRSGYKFKGWLAQFADRTVMLQPGFTYGYDESARLTAQWSQESYDIIFHANGGINAPAIVQKYGGVPLTLPTQVPTRSGYVFQGWSMNQQTTEADYQPSEVLKEEGDRQFYAVWKPVGTFSVPTSYEAAQAMVDYSATPIGTTPGRVRYMAQITADPYFVNQYWYWTKDDVHQGSISPGNKCTRCALSMALSFFGLNYTPGNMSSIYGSADIPSPLVDIPNMLTMVERVNEADFDALWASYSTDRCFSPIVLYFDYKHPDGTIHEHAVLIIGKNGDTYYAVDSAANSTHVIELTFNADKSAIQTCSYARYADTSAIKGVLQWQLTGNVERTAYTITYDWSDNIVTRTYGSKEHGVDTTLSRDLPVYGDLTFAGWALADDLKKPVYQPGDPYTKDADLYLYAVWQDQRHHLTGKVIDATVNGANYGQPIAGVTVEFFDSDGFSIGTATTGSDGVYSFAFTKYDAYTRVFTKAGYQSMTVEYLVVNENTPSMGIVVLMEGESGGLELPDPEPDRNIIAEGDCGTNLTWALDDEGWLTIAGTGDMTTLGSSSQAPWYEYREQITHLAVGDGVTSIEMFAIYDYDNLVYVDLGRSVTKIGTYAFEQCEKLETLVLPDAVSQWGSSVFTGAPIKTVIVPETVTIVPEGLCNFSTIQEFRAEDSDGLGYFDDDGILYHKNPLSQVQTLVRCPQSKGLTGTYKVLDGTHVIGTSAFRDVDYVKKIQVPGTVTEIGQSAFWDCGSLETVELSEGLETIGATAFYNCDWLETIRLPDTLITTDGSVFQSCNNLTEVDLGRSLEMLGSYAFQDCGKLQTITVPNAMKCGASCFVGTTLKTVILPKTVQSLHSEIYNLSMVQEFRAEDRDSLGYFDDDGILYYRNPLSQVQTLIRCPESKGLTGTYAVLDGTEVIGASAFRNVDYVKEIQVPGTVTEIGQSAFWDCGSLQSVELAEGLETLGATVFYNCDRLETVCFPDSMISIGGSAFESCDNLTEIRFGRSLTDSGNYLVKNCGKIQKAYFYGPAPRTNSYIFQGAPAGFTIYYLQTQSGWSSPKWNGYPAYPFAGPGTAEEYEINSISLKGDDGAVLAAIPKESFKATVSITNRSVEPSDTVVLLAAYTKSGQFRDWMAIGVEDCPVGATVKVTLPVDNKSGDIAELKAFTVSAAGTMTPLGDAVVFPAP